MHITCALPLYEYVTCIVNVWLTEIIEKSEFALTHGFEGTFTHGVNIVVLERRSKSDRKGAKPKFSPLFSVAFCSFILFLGGVRHLRSNVHS